jgi:sugar-specific transcriptional regulator TrmB
MLREEGTLQSLESREAAEKLEKIALSRLESRVYLALLQNGQKKASEISDSIDANRVDVYRCLKKLRQRGILEVTFSRPLKFSAVEPEVLQMILISEQELSLRGFRAEVAKLCEQLKTLPVNKDKANLSLQEALSKERKGGARFELKQGRQVFEKWKRMVENSKDETLIILSHIGLMTHSVEGFSDLYSKASRRGVSIKMITEVDKENFDQAIEFSKICSLKIARSASEMLRYIIVDNDQAMISGGYPSNDPKEFTGICTNNLLLIKSLRLDFKDKWRRAKPFQI